MKQITEYMKEQFDPTIYIVRERHKFWSDMTRKPGETIHELAARIRQDAVTCEFAAIKDPQDEVLRTRFPCSVNNEAVLKATFRVKDEELTFATQRPSPLPMRQKMHPVWQRKPSMDLQSQRYTRSTTRTTVQNLQHKTQHRRKLPALDQPSSHSQKAHVGDAIRPPTQRRNVLKPVQYAIIARRPGILRLLVCRNDVVYLKQSR